MRGAIHLNLFSVLYSVNKRRRGPEQVLTLNLIQISEAVYSTPDGSCLIAADVPELTLTVLTAYHWSTFGWTYGVPLEIPDLPLDQPLLLTSLIKGASFIWSHLTSTQILLDHSALSTSLAG
jgi:hypothetical protein